MSCWEVFALEKIPICKDTEDDRQEMLAKLKSTPDSSKPGGKAYWYTKFHVGTKTGKKRKVVNLSKEGDFVTIAEHADAVQTLDRDWQKMKSRKAGKLAVKDISDEESPEEGNDDDMGSIKLTDKGKWVAATAKAKRRGKGKGRGNNLASAIQSMGLTPKQQMKAKQLLDKKSWLKNVNATVASMIKEIENMDVTQKKITSKSRCIGPKILTDWNKQSKTLKPAKNALKQQQQAAEGQDPAWFVHPKQQKTMAAGMKALSEFKKYKDNCLKAIAMGN